MCPQKFFRLVKQAAVAWNDDNATTLGAAIAYYTVFSLAPLLLIAISMASLLVGEEQARSGIGDQIRKTLGPVTADAITAMLNNSQRSGGKIGVTLLGGAALLIGASGAFVQLQEALNLIWKTAAQPRRGNFLVYFLRNRLLSFAAVLGTGFLLLVSLIVSTLLAAAEHWMPSDSFAGEAAMWHGVFMVVSLGFVTLLFALIFKLLPDVPIAWRDVWLGALLTAVLFTGGQQLIGLYLGQSSVASAYGAAGSLVIVLLWVYYSAQIVLFGAEFTHVYANTHGSHAESREAAHQDVREAMHVG